MPCAEVSRDPSGMRVYVVNVCVFIPPLPRPLLPYTFLILSCSVCFFFIWRHEFRMGVGIYGAAGVGVGGWGSRRVSVACWRAKNLRSSQRTFTRGLESVLSAADATVQMRLHHARFSCLLLKLLVYEASSH